MTDITSIIAITNSVSSLSNLIDAVQDLVVSTISGLTAVISASAVIAKYMPPPSGPGLLAAIHKIINSCAQNAGYAENAKAEE